MAALTKMMMMMVLAWQVVAVLVSLDALHTDSPARRIYDCDCRRFQGLPQPAFQLLRRDRRGRHLQIAPPARLGDVARKLGFTR